MGDSRSGSGGSANGECSEEGGGRGDSSVGCGVGGVDGVEVVDVVVVMEVILVVVVVVIGWLLSN